jgi:molybdopterin-containing oxidoreductase family membrane subunit
VATDYTKQIPFSQVNHEILGNIRTPGNLYKIFVSALAALVVWGVVVWVYQTRMGMGITGINHPVGWGVYITNFVFWVGIAHSGTLISAILFLVRSNWRDAVSRSTEAMTVFAVLTAALFPLIHLGRVWVFYYIMPYPNQRDLYPNFMSPLVLDLLAVITYLTVSIIFFYYGLIPDAAAARDKFEKEKGIRHPASRIFRAISLGWSGTLNQWRHYNRAYLYFAMLATPLVISVHSIVSWDFAASILPGWHSTIFAPYFVAGAIHSGLAMGLTLMIPMRKFLKIGGIITEKHLEAIAKMILLTTAIIAYTYIVEPLMELFTNDVFHLQFLNWRLTGSMSWIYFLIMILNVIIPLSFALPKYRQNVKWLFIASLLINIGMWLERYFIVVGSTAHDFMPHNWGEYLPSWVEVSITLGTAALFLLLFLLFARLLPVVSLTDFKEYLLKGEETESEKSTSKQSVPSEKAKVVNRTKLLVFSSPEQITKAVEEFINNDLKNINTFSPVRLHDIEKLTGKNKSPVGIWTFLGGLAGFFAGYLLTMGSVDIYDLIVGGKHSASIFPYFLVMFELMILFAALTNFIAVIIYSKIGKQKVHHLYNPRYGIDKYGMTLDYKNESEPLINSIITNINPETVKDISYEAKE